MITFFLEKQKGFTIFAASLKLTIMRKVITSLVLALFVTIANAQYYGVGSSTSSTDSWGNTTTVHKDAYGNRTGTSTSRTAKTRISFEIRFLINTIPTGQTRSMPTSTMITPSTPPVLALLVQPSSAF